MSDELIGKRYRIIYFLKRTSFCETYVAEDIWLPSRTRCIIKKFRPQLNEQFRLETARFLFAREAQILYQLNDSPHIPQLLAHLQLGEDFFLVQEFIEGQNLSQTEIVLGKCWSEEQVIAFLEEVLEILAFVHQNKIIHQNIKPSSLIRSIDDGKIVLTGFDEITDITNQTLAEEEKRSLSVAVATPSYTPNEQQTGKPRFNSDIYALGMTAIQAMTGLFPNQLRQDSLTGEVSRSNYSSQCSSGLANILNRMVRKDFRERYQNVNEVICDLQKLSEDDCSQDWQTKIIVADHLRIKKHRLLLWFAILPLALVIIILSQKMGYKFPTEGDLQPNNTLIKKEEDKQVIPEKLTPIAASKDVDKSKMYARLSELLIAKQFREADKQTWELMKQVAVKDGNYGGISFSELESLSCFALRTIDILWIQHSDGHFGFSVQRQIYKSLAGNKLNSNLMIFRSFALQIGWKKDIDYPTQEYKHYSDLSFSLDSPRGNLPALGSLFWDYQLGVSDLSKAEYHERFASLVLRLEECNI